MSLCFVFFPPKALLFSASLLDSPLLCVGVFAFWVCDRGYGDGYQGVCVWACVYLHLHANLSAHILLRFLAFVPRDDIFVWVSFYECIKVICALTAMISATFLLGSVCVCVCVYEVGVSGAPVVRLH